MCRNAKAQYEAELFKANNPKRFYNYINTKLKNKAQDIHLYNDQGEICDDPVGAANILANQFFKVFTKECPDLPPKEKVSVPCDCQPFPDLTLNCMV